MAGEGVDRQPSRACRIVGRRRWVGNADGAVVKRINVQADVLWGRLTRAFMRSRATEATPYFVASSFLAPHGGGPPDPDDPAHFTTPYVAPKFRDTYEGPSPARDPAFNEQDISDKRREVQNMPRPSRRVKSAIRESNEQ